MTPLVQQRCQFHALREAVARCPECGRFFCRECVTEHEDRMVCASCLRRITGGAGATGRALWSAAGRLALCLAGTVLAWCCFYILGQWLLGLPSQFHEGSLWTNMM